MKTKTIKAILRKKFDRFVKSIDDKNVRDLVKNNSIITGGSIASMLLREPVNDYDVYFTNADTVRAVAEYYTMIFNKRNTNHCFEILDGTIPKKDMLSQFNGSRDDTWYRDNIIDGRIKIRVCSSGVASEDGFEQSDTPEQFLNQDLSAVEDGGSVPDADIPNVVNKKEFRPVYISANAITLSDDFQLIIRFFGDVETIHSNYDFAHCMCSWTSIDGKLITPSEALECLLTKELRYKGSKYPLASIIRSRKFIKRGFSINAGQYLKMCLQLNDINLRDITVIEDQLVGVDACWFAMMLEHVDDDKLRDDIDNTYMFELINRFF